MTRRMVIEQCGRLFSAVAICSVSLVFAQEYRAPLSSPNAAESTVWRVTSSAEQQARAFDIARKPWTGDFDQMLERRVVRVLVPYSRTLYFNDKGRQRGITAFRWAYRV